MLLLCPSQRHCGVVQLLLKGKKQNQNRELAKSEWVVFVHTEIQDRNRFLKLFSLAKIKDFLQEICCVLALFLNSLITLEKRTRSEPRLCLQAGSAERMSWGQLLLKGKAGGLVHPLTVGVLKNGSCPCPALCQGLDGSLFVSPGWTGGILPPLYSAIFLPSYMAAAPRLGSQGGTSSLLWPLKMAESIVTWPSLPEPESPCLRSSRLESSLLKQRGHREPAGRGSTLRQDCGHPSPLLSRDPSATPSPHQCPGDLSDPSKQQGVCSL